MTDPWDAVNIAFARVVVLTWRGVWLNVVLVALAGVSLCFGTYHRPFPWTGALNGLIVGLAGYQLWLADGQFMRLGTSRSHAWVRPLAVAFLAIGMVLLALGILAAAHRVAAA
jgi:hypothetical protein